MATTAMQKLKQARILIILVCAASLPASCGPVDEADISGLLGQGLFYALGAMFLAGILTSFTPCVYPMIPITVSIFGAKGSSSKLRAFTLSLVYTMGIAFTYSALGVIAALTGTAFGSYMSSPPVMILIVTIFVLLGLSMAGIYEISPPPSMINKLSKLGGVGHQGAFLMGLVAGFVAAPCTGPVLAGVLTYVATTKSAAVGALLLFIYALGMGLLFIVIGTFSGIAGSLPKSGRWMDVVRSVFAVVIFAVAAWFLKNLFPPIQSAFERPVLGIVFASALLAAGAAAGGLHLDVSMPGRLRKLRKAAASIAFGLGIYGIIVTFSPAPLQSPKWETDWKTAMIVAKSAGSPAIIDFYADWCTACKELDHGTWSAPEVIAESERFTMIRVDATAAGEDIDKLEDDLDVVGLPAVLFLDADGKEIKNLRVTGFIRPARMLEKMRSVK